MTTENLSDADIFASGTEPVRDDQGRFASGEQSRPDPQETRPATEETPTPNLGQLPSGGEGRSEPQAGQEGQGEPQARQPQMVPLSEVQSERRKRQGYESDLAARDRELAEMRGQMAVFQRMMQQQGHPQQQRSQEQPKAPDPYDDPQGFAEFQAQQVFQRQFDPFARAFQEHEQRLQRTITGMQRAQTVAQYGADAARSAEEAFNTAAARGEIDPHEHARINNSDNPYAAAVEWHRRQKNHERIGGDPDKWFSSEFERRAKEDPAFQQQMYAFLNGQAQQHQAAGAQSPAAGKQPPVIIPPSLNGAAGAPSRGPSSVSEDDIYAAAPQRMGRRG